MTANLKLLEPVVLSDQLKLKNRIVMAPMTRCKATQNGDATEDMSRYYARRADAGLIITEGTVIRPDAIGYPQVPGIYTQSHVDKWRAVTDAVHANNGKIMLQIWHVGRVSHPHFLHGQLPISCSATTMKGRIHRSNGLHYGKSRAVSLDEIEVLVNDFARAAKNALEAGFDGIEIHGANGYLIDQFLHYDTNHREDAYGGNSENMIRFASEIVNACINEIGCDRVGIRLSPGPYLNEINVDRRDQDVFVQLLAKLSKLNIAYVHTGAFDDSQTYKELNNLTMTQFIRQHYTGNVIACGSYTIDKACSGIAERKFDCAAFGRPFIANSDLVSKIKNGVTLTAYDTSMLDSLE